MQKYPTNHTARTARPNIKNSEAEHQEQLEKKFTTELQTNIANYIPSKMTKSKKNIPLINRSARIFLQWKERLHKHVQIPTNETTIANSKTNGNLNLERQSGLMSTIV